MIFAALFLLFGFWCRIFCLSFHFNSNVVVFFFHSIESSFTDKVIETYNWETALDFKCMKKNIHIQIMMMMMAE